MRNNVAGVGHTPEVRPTRTDFGWWTTVQHARTAKAIAAKAVTQIGTLVVDIFMAKQRNRRPVAIPGNANRPYRFVGNQWRDDCAELSPNP